MIELILNENTANEYHFNADDMRESLITGVLSLVKVYPLTQSTPSLVAPTSTVVTSTKLMENGVEVPLVNTYVKIVDLASSISSDLNQEIRYSMSLATA